MIPAPNACRHCWIQKRSHGQQWAPDVGWHMWTPPTDAQIFARMRARRAERTNREDKTMSMPTPTPGDTVRQPSEYMRPGMAAWTTQEREHIERVNARMEDGWGDAYRERPDGGDDDA